MTEITDQITQILIRLSENRDWLVSGFAASIISLFFYRIATALHRYRLTKKYFARKYKMKLSIKDDKGVEKSIYLPSNADQSEIISRIREVRGRAFIEDLSTDDNR